MKVENFDFGNSQVYFSIVLCLKAQTLLINYDHPYKMFEQKYVRFKSDVKKDQLAGCLMVTISRHGSRSTFDRIEKDPSQNNRWMKFVMSEQGFLSTHARH